MSYRPDVRRAPYEALHDLWNRWDSKVRYDGQVLGALELAYLRGYQGGYQDARAGKPAEHYVEPKARKRKKK